jgi:DHA1 family bicyclomycin/chloramphenicol resistance-like MFS transporter
MEWQQRYFSKTGMIAFLVLISAFPPLTTDIYLPALPQLKNILQTTQSMVNLTLSLYFVFFATGMLFWGPLSEKYGRKKILLVGISAYIIASLGCAASQDIFQLVSCRGLQAFAGSSSTAIASAMVKDLYTGREREKVLALVFSMVIIAPIVAPVIGAILLSYTSWRAVFLLLAAVGVIAVVVTQFLDEPLVERYNGSLVESWGRLVVVVRNPGFAVLLLLFSMIPMTFMSFLAASSFVYVDIFAQSERQYSFFLAFNSCVSMLAPGLYVRISNHLQPKHIITLGFMLLAVAGTLIITIGDLSPYLFAVLVGVATLSVITLKVPATNLMLEQQKNDTGSASALINCTGMILASVGMYLVTLSPENLIRSLGMIQVTIGVLCVIFWLAICNKSFARYDFHRS